jgi:transposase
MLIAFIQQEFGIVYSPSGVRKLLHNLGYSYKQLNLFPGDANLEKQATFIDDYTQLEAEMTPKTAILFLDGVHPVHNTRPSKTWSLKGVRDYIRSNTGRERVNINGAYDPHRQEVITHISEKVNTESTIELLDLVKQKYPKDYTIHLFADNARYYHSLGLRNYLAENPRFQLYYLPPYSPNLNLIERLWKFMRKNVLDAKYYPTAQTFRQAIIEFFAQIHTQRAELETFIGYRFQTLT